jgi:hypothetical protein
MANDDVRSHLRAALAAAVSDSEKHWQRQHEEVQSQEARRRGLIRPLTDTLKELEREINDRKVFGISYNDRNQSIQVYLGGGNNLESIAEYMNALVRGYQPKAPTESVISVSEDGTGFVEISGSGENEWRSNFAAANEVLESFIERVAEFLAMRKVMPKESDE